MLIKLLGLLQEGRTCSLEELAQLLQTGVPAIRTQLEYLERLGYIKKVPPQTGCGPSCHGCKGCGRNVAFPVIWELKK
jgi:predicted ArsR family transcriptional regulator